MDITQFLDILMWIYPRALVVAGSVMYASNFEWLLHKFVMHRPIFGFTYAYKGHWETHHQIFDAGKTYELSNHPHDHQEKDKKTIPMAWWNWIVLLILALIPVVGICTIFQVWWPIPITGFVFIVYYCFYEYFHWCMHDPKGRWFENMKWFKNLNKRHHIHHARPNLNFNVVWPFADWMFGTLKR